MGISRPSSLFHLVAGVLFFSGFSAAVCVDANAFEATAEQREACTPDAFRLCSAEIPDEARVAQCMIANKSRLSGRCLASFHPANAGQVREVRQLLHEGPPSGYGGPRHVYVGGVGSPRYPEYGYRVGACEWGNKVVELCGASGDFNPGFWMCQRYRACHVAWR